MSYVVVLLSHSECAAYPGNPCVMEVIGPFATNEEAKELAASYPDWTKPHTMLINEPPKEKQ